MKQKTKAAILSVFVLDALILAMLPCFARENSQKQEESVSPQSSVSVVVLPFVLYMPETKWGGGVGGLLTFRPSKNDPSARPSALYFYLMYTQLKQFTSQFQPEFYFSNEKYLLTGKLTIEQYPDKLWGMGPSTPDQAEENFTPRTFSLEVSWQKKIWPAQNLYAGLQGFFETYHIVKSEPGMSLASGKWPGSKGGTSTGLGFIVNLDQRDNVFFPTRGVYCQLGATFNAKFLGGGFDYASIKLDLRKYLLLFGSHVLAFQGLFQAVPGTPPFRAYPKLGGDSIMRGYYAGRYRDRCLLAFQAEYRLPLIWRFGLTGFAGLGDVAGRPSKFNLETFKPSLGFGLRFKIVRKEGTNVRLDFAWGKGTSGFYLTAKEAF
jgi:outer membrane protein assembly factor BamA